MTDMTAARAIIKVHNLYDLPDRVHELEALLGTRVYLETHVKVDKDWQRRPEALDRLGY